MNHEVQDDVGILQSMKNRTENKNWIDELNGFFLIKQSIHTSDEDTAP